MVKISSLVAPGTVPLHLTPRVPETHQPDFSLLVLRRFALQGNTNTGEILTFEMCLIQLVNDELYLLHCCHRVGVTLHKSRHGTSLKTSRNQRLRTHRTHVGPVCSHTPTDLFQPEDVSETQLFRLSDSHRWSSP